MLLLFRGLGAYLQWLGIKRWMSIWRRERTAQKNRSYAGASVRRRMPATTDAEGAARYLFWSLGIGYPQAMGENTQADSSEIALRRERRRRKLWQVAFLFCLVAFEVARETAVLNAAQRARPQVWAQVYEQDGDIYAHGVWQREDEGFPASPVAVTIICRRDGSAECAEATEEPAGSDIQAPGIQWFPAVYGAHDATYKKPAEAPLSDCVEYFITVDLKAETARAYSSPSDDAPSATKCPPFRAVKMALVSGSGGFAVASRLHVAPIMYAFFGPHRSQAIHSPRRPIWNACLFVLMVTGLLGALFYIFKDNIASFFRYREEYDRYMHEHYRTRSRILPIACGIYALAAFIFFIYTFTFDY